MPDEPKQPDGPKPRLIPSAIAALLEKYSWTKPLLEWGKYEAKGIRQGWQLFGVLMALLIVFASLGTCRVTRSRADSRMVATNQAFAIANSFLLGRYDAKQDENSKLSETVKENTAKANNEILNLKMEVNNLNAQLAPWKALAANIYTNELPHKRLDLLLDEVRSITNELRLLSPSALRFEMLANGNLLTNNSEVEVSVRQGLQMGVRNAGEITAENVTIALVMAVSETNVLADGWALRGNMQLRAGELPVGLAPMWMVKAEFSLGSGQQFGAPPIRFLTNLSGHKIIGRVRVHSDRSKDNTLAVAFSFTP